MKLEVTNRIAELGKQAEASANAVIQVDGVSYRRGDLQRIEPEAERKKPIATTLVVNTLRGLADYLKSPAGQEDAAGSQSVDPSPLVVHVVSHDHVRVFSSLIGFQKQREFLIEAKYNEEAHPFKTNMKTESFIIWLRSRFVPTEDSALLLRMVGNVRDGAVKTIEDDGISQKVNVAVGVSRLGEAQVKSPVKLQPYRTFNEVEQPQSEFIVRMYPGDSEAELPTASLIEADGGAWKLEAVLKIRRFLETELPGYTVIG